MMREPKESNEGLGRVMPGLFLPGGEGDHKKKKHPVLLLQDDPEARYRASPPIMNSDSDCACE